MRVSEVVRRRYMEVKEDKGQMICSMKKMMVKLMSSISFFLLLSPFISVLFTACKTEYDKVVLQTQHRWVEKKVAVIYPNRNAMTKTWLVVQSLVVMFAVYTVYTSNAGEMMREYLSQVISIVFIVFLLWRMETLQELESEEEMENGSLRSNYK